MYRLGELTEQQRRRYGSAMLVVGTVLMVVAVWWVHYSSFPLTEVVDGETQPVVLGEFNWVPRGWLWKSLGYLAAFGASQLLVVGAALAFVLGRPMTWARAAFAAFLAWIELVVIFGIVPSEWLNLSQTDLNWSSQRVALTIPPILVLGNQVDISLAVVKDMISMGYNLTMLGAGAVFAYKLQQMRKGRPPAAEKPAATSPYGRPLIRGGG